MFVRTSEEPASLEILKEGRRSEKDSKGEEVQVEKGEQQYSILGDNVTLRNNQSQCYILTSFANDPQSSYSAIVVMCH